MSQIPEEQLKRFEGISHPKDKINYYFTDRGKGETVDENSIFIKSYEELSKRMPDDIRGRYKTHILLVGFSIQPIVLSISAIQAERILFLFSEDTKPKCYEIVEWIKKIEDYFQRNRKVTFIGVDNWHEDSSPYLVDSSDPEDTYNRINEIIKSENKNGFDLSEIALDITGGKKTMVSGAFTAAAISGIDTYYIDFAVYEKDKPEPGTEFLRRLNNPIDFFIKNLKSIFLELNNKAISYTLLGNRNRDFLDFLIKQGYLEKKTDENNDTKITKKVFHEEQLQ